MKKSSIFPFALSLLVLAFSVAINAQDHGCPRGAATPVLKQAVFPKAKFRLAGNNGVETLSLGGGERLIVKTWGCEYYVLTFRFETSRYRHSTRDLEYWFRNAVGRMNEVLPGVDAQIDIEKAVRKLKSYIETQRKTKYRNLKLGEEIMFGGDELDPNGDDITQNVSVENIQKLKNGRYALDISFAAGPL
ncbi:MAG: hypothetical protein ACKVQJ_03940 [Pyrinomonadaceae bacterium]